MPYIKQEQRDFIEQQPNDLLAKIGQSLGTLKGEDKIVCAQYVAFSWLRSLYPTQNNFQQPKFFEANNSTFTQIDSLTQEIALNLSKLNEEQGGADGLLNYTLTRFFNESFVAARYKDYNDIIGILESLKSHFPSIASLGMLTCCQMEYYRKYAAPYEDLKEDENGKVLRPQALSTSY